VNTINRNTIIRRITNTIRRRATIEQEARNTIRLTGSITTRRIINSIINEEAHQEEEVVEQ